MLQYYVIILSLKSDYRHRENQLSILRKVRDVSMYTNVKAHLNQHIDL